MVDHDYSTIGSVSHALDKKSTLIEKSASKIITSNQKVSQNGSKQLTKKQLMNVSFKEINLQLFVELSRIKKP